MVAFMSRIRPSPSARDMATPELRTATRNRSSLSDRASNSVTSVVTSTICVIVPWNTPSSSRIADTVMSDQVTLPSPVRYLLRVR